MRPTTRWLALQSPAVLKASNLGGGAQDQISDKAETYVSTSRARAERKSAIQWIRTIESHQGSLCTTCSASWWKRGAGAAWRQRAAQPAAESAWNYCRAARRKVWTYPYIHHFHRVRTQRTQFTSEAGPTADRQVNEGSTRMGEVGQVLIRAVGVTC